MTDMDLVEHVARQLCIAKGYNPDLVGKLGRPRWWLFASKATHVLPLLAEAWDEGKRAGLRQSDWEHGDTATPYIATNPYRKDKTDD